MTQIIRADVTSQVDVTRFSGKILRTQTDVSVLTRHTHGPVLTGARVAQVDLGVARIPGLHPGKPDRACARVVLDGVHRSEHERLRFESPLLASELKDRAALFKIKARFTHADVVIEGKKFKEQKFLKQVFVQVDALFDVGRVEVVFIVCAAHRRRERHVQDFDVTLNFVGFDAEDLKVEKGMKF